MDNKDIKILLQKEAIPACIFFKKNQKRGIEHLLRFTFVIALTVGSLRAWTDSADVSIGLNLSPIPTNNPSTSIPPGFKLNLINYNKDEYLLAYNVFVMNGSVGLAYEVASSAVKQRPKSLFWRKKLIDVALWSGHSETALEQLMYFINNGITPEHYINDALTLATQLNDYDSQEILLRRQLLSEPKDKSTILKYSNALQNQGYPLDALTFLNKQPNATNDPDYLAQFIIIAKGMDNPQLQANYLQRLRQVKPQELKPAMDYAELLYMKGDIKGAYQIYHNAAGLPDTKIAFWRNYASIALLAGENQSAIDAYRHLVNKDAMDSSSLLQMITLEVEAGQNLAAYNDAKVAYQKTSNPVLIPIILSLAEQQQHWQEMKYFLAKIPQDELSKLQQKPEFSLMLVNLDVHLGLYSQARRTWQWIFQRWPNLTIVQQAYLWFLIDTNDIRQLEYTLAHWRRTLTQNASLWKAYVSGLTNIGDYPLALTMMLRHKNETRLSYELLTNLADLLVQNDRFYEAYYTGQKAFFLLRRKIRAQHGQASIEQKLQLIELSELFAPATTNHSLILQLKDKLFKNERVDHQVISWALKNRSYPLASYIVEMHKRYKISTPPWMTLTLALLYNDRDTMADMLFHFPKRLPYRDRVMAAVKTGNLKLAEDYAYFGLKEHPKDPEMYKLFEDVMLPRANRFSVGGGQYNVGRVGGPFTRESLRYYITPSIVAMPYNSFWFPHINDPSQIAWAPDFNQVTGLALRKYIEKGWLQASIAERTSMENFVIGKLKIQQQLTARTSARLSLNYHAIADETDTLLIGGMQNEGILMFETVWDSYNTLISQFRVQEFLGQDESFLGTGETLQLVWQHKFYLNYPDWNVNYYFTWANFQNSNDPLSAKLQRFVPPDAPNDSAFFMPNSYVEGAITLGVGQQYRQNYTHPWRFFGEAGVLYNSPFGLGEIVQGGLAGSVFGRDHLALYAEYSFNQQQASQSNYTIGIRYDNYF